MWISHINRIALPGGKVRLQMSLPKGMANSIPEYIDDFLVIPVGDGSYLLRPMDDRLRREMLGNLTS